MVPNTCATKVKNKLGFIKAKNICATKDTMKKVKRQSTEWEKNFVNYILDNRLMSRIYKGFVPRIYKELLQLNN